MLQVALQFNLCKPRQLHMNLSEVLRAHLELPHAILPGPINYVKVSLLPSQYAVTEPSPTQPSTAQQEQQA